jgi:hypothetical protein
MLVLLRSLIAGLGAVMLAWITSDLLAGQITYGVGDITERRVTPRTLAEAVSIWAAFASPFGGLLILGIRPQLYVERAWVWKALLATLVIGYVAASLLR